MKKNICLAVLGPVALLVPALAGAQSPFDGTWKADLSKVNFPTKPDVFLLTGGMYSCKSCAPPYTVKADGADHAVTGHPYFDSVAIKVVGDHEIQETDKKSGKVVGTSTTTISADGKTASFTFSDASDTNGGAPITGKGEAARVAAGPAGSHAVSGSWRTTKMQNLSDNGITVTFKVANGELTMSQPTGQTYTAKLNGPDAPMKGDPGITSVAVKTTGTHTFVETDKRDGKVISVLTFTVAPDGKTAKASFDDKQQMRTTTYAAVKQ